MLTGNWKNQLEPLSNPIGGFEIGLKTITGRDVRRGDYIFEVVFESSGRNDLEDPARAITGIPESVPSVAGLEDEVARLREDCSSTKPGSHLALQHIALFVLTRVTMQRSGEVPRRDRVLNERETRA